METQNTTQEKTIFLQSIRKILGEFYTFFGLKKLIFTIFGIIIATILSVIEPIFMAKTISFIENFYATKTFDTNGFLIFLGIWAGFIVINTTVEYIRRYFLQDKPALEFHNFFAQKYVDKVYFMTMKEYLGKKS